MKRILKLLNQDIHQSFFVVALCAGIIVGAILAQIFRIYVFTSFVWIVFAAIVLVFAYLRPKSVFIVVLVVVGMIIIFFRTSLDLRDVEYIKQFIGREILVSGVIESDPETDEQITKLKIRGLKFGDQRNEIRGSIFVSLRKNEDLRRNDVVQFSGELLAGFGSFAGYMYKPAIIEVKRPEPGDITLRIRDWFANRVRDLLPSPQVELGLSYLLGMKSGLSEELSENLRVIGLVHIVVASGAHLSILVEIARKIFGALSRFAGMLFSIVFVVFFMIMVGFTPSILRAGAMSVLTIMAWYVGRRFVVFRIILLVAAGTLLFNPNFIINLGWLLSFAAYGGIMILGPWLAKFFYGDKKPGFIGGMVITTISATLMTLPIILYFYGAVSLISVIANLLILPTLPYAMGLVFLTGVFSGVFGVEQVFSFLANKMLEFHIFIVNEFGAMGFFLIQIEKEQIWVFGFYLVILCIAVFSRQMRRKKENQGLLSCKNSI